MAAIDEILVSVWPGEVRAALVCEGEIVEFIVDRGGPAPGDVILARVLSVTKNLSAAFVAIGDIKPGFLGRATGLKEGDAVAVRITQPARREKGAALARADSEIPKGAKPPQPLKSVSLLARLHAMAPDARIVLDESSLMAEARALFPAAEIDARAFARHDADDAFEAALEPRVPLPSGVTLAIEETSGGVVIDIDSGGLSPQAANAAALPEIARQLRLRNLAGHILIDIIPGRDPKARQRLVAELRELTKDDSAPVRVVGTTPMGMIELVRERSRLSLAEIMLDMPSARRNDETIALDGIRQFLRDSLSRPSARLALALPPSALAVLSRRPEIAADAAKRLGAAPVIVEKSGIAGFEIVERPR